MLRTFSTLTLGLLVLAGCPGDDSSTSGAGTADSSSTAATTDPNTDTNPPGTTTGESADTTSSPSTTDTPGTTTEEPASTTDTPGTTTDEPGTTDDSTTGTMGGACEPDPAGEECAECVKDMCCEELEACNADPTGGCPCFQECAQMNPGIGGAMQCATDCDVDLFGAGPTGALGQCTLASCNVCLG